MLNGEEEEDESADSAQSMPMKSLSKVRNLLSINTNSKKDSKRR